MSLRKTFFNEIEGCDISVLNQVNLKINRVIKTINDPLYMF